MFLRVQFLLISFFFALALWLSIKRDVIIEKHYTGDLRNRVVGARLQMDGISPYFFKWHPGLSLRYYDPAKFDTTYASVITASPFFHHLLFPIANLPQKKISQIWLVLEYLFFFAAIVIAFSFTKNIQQQWAVTICASLLLFTQAWVVHILAGQMYVLIPFLAFLFLFFFIRKKNLLFSFLSGLAAVTMVLIRPTSLIFFLPFLLLWKEFSLKQFLFFIIPGIILIGYSVFNKQERGYWLDYRKGIEAHIRHHQSDDVKERELAYKPVIYSDWEGFNMDSIRKIDSFKTATEGYQGLSSWHSETSSIGVLTKVVLHKTIPRWAFNILLPGTIILLMIFFVLLRKNNQNLPPVMLTAIFAFCLYMISDFLSPLWRIQYYTVQWSFPLLLLSAYYDRKFRIIFLLLFFGVLLNISNTPFIKMRHTIGEGIILLTLLYLCFSKKFLLSHSHEQ